MLINEYGPTETVVVCCVYRVGDDEPLSTSIPIGRPIINTQLYILDEWVRPVPLGVTGELYVGGEQVAVFVLAAGDVFAIDDRDPFTGSLVLSRGLVGDAEGIPTVASPIYKQRFDLRTGQCLDDPSVGVRTWPIRIEDGWVEVGTP